jgi:hypothetical protein
MRLKSLVRLAADKQNFETLQDYIGFALRYLEFVATGLQAVIVSQNESHYQFFQYKADGAYNITRPLNSDLMYDAATSGVIASDFLRILQEARSLPPGDTASRAMIRKSIYTIQQSVGSALDALPAGRSNTARKINGDLFERLIRLLIQELGVECVSDSIRVPVTVAGVVYAPMNYQHDLIIKQGEVIKVIGGVKTSSKDRLDKIFMDKYLFTKLTNRQIPHVAIFLNDVQRKNTKQRNRYGVNATFLPGHFIGYTVTLCPLDGVYYCDIRPNMTTDPILKQHIRTIDHFFCTDLWRFLGPPPESQRQTR